MSEDEAQNKDDLENKELETSVGKEDSVEDAVAVEEDIAVSAEVESNENSSEASLTEAIHLADELVKTRVEKIHEAGERSVTQAVQSMETLMGSVLDSAEAATKASATANISTNNLLKVARKLDDAAHQSSKVSTIVLSVGGAMLFISVAVFGFMAAQLSKRSAELENMVLAVGKRVVEMNVGLEQFQMVNNSILQVNTTQEAFRDAQLLLTERVNELSAGLQMVQSEVPAKTAESVGRQSEAFSARVKDVEKRIQSQQKVTSGLAKSLKNVSGQVSSLRKDLKGVSELNKDVEALVTLQRERYYELLQAQAKLKNETTQETIPGAMPASAVENVIIRYPNPEAALPKPEGID